MSDDINYNNNPLHGVGLKTIVEEMVSYYGFNILFAYLRINCFKTNPSIESSVKFLKKTEWAREKVEAFYMYQFKNLPRASAEQFELPPRDRIVPESDKPGEPKELSLEDAERLHEKRAMKREERDSRGGRRYENRGGDRPRSYANERPKERRESRHDESSKSSASTGKVDPWAKARRKFGD